MDTLLRDRSPNGQRKCGYKPTGAPRGRKPRIHERMVVTERFAPFPDQQIAIDKLRKVPARLVADSMGVGKTVTGVGLDFAMREDNPNHKEGPTLIICEKIGLDVWDFHLQAMGVPIEQICIIDPTNRDKFVDALKELIAFQGYKAPRMTKKGVPDRRITSGPKTDRPRYRYYICHWDVLVLIDEINDRTKSGRALLNWSHVIADEVHLAKNRKALRTLELKRIATAYKTGLSGTPADDKPQDLWSVLHWLYPRKYSSYWSWVGEYVEIDVSAAGYRKLLGPRLDEMPKLHRELWPFYIRRTLLEINPDMPDKIHVRPLTVVQLGTQQRRAYEDMKEKALALIGGEDSGRGGFTLMAPAVIAVLTRLQQMAMCTLTPEWKVEDTSLDDADGFDTDWDFPDIVMSTPSPKLDAVMNYITTQDTEPFVVFTQFRSMADLVEEQCKLKGIPVGKIHGGILSKNKRTDIVREFQSGKSRVFVGTIAAAGKTITLDRANHVIFIDRSWNPSKNEQAEDRLWRRTQKNTVRVIDIEAEDTIDQWRREMIDEKGKRIVDLLNAPKDARLTPDLLTGAAMRDALAMFLQS